MEIPAGAVTAAAPSDSGNPSVAAESATPHPAAVETPVAATVAATRLNQLLTKLAVAAKYSTMSWSQFARPMQPHRHRCPQNASPAVSTVPRPAN